MLRDCKLIIASKALSLSPDLLSDLDARYVFISPSVEGKKILSFFWSCFWTIIGGKKIRCWQQIHLFLIGWSKFKWQNILYLHWTVALSYILSPSLGICRAVFFTFRWQFLEVGKCSHLFRITNLKYSDPCSDIH